MKNLIILLFAIGLASCGDPDKFVRKARVVPTRNAVAGGTAHAKATAPAAPTNPNDEMRIGDMLGLPSDEQLRPSAVPSGNGAAPVTVRPPKE